MGIDGIDYYIKCSRCEHHIKAYTSFGRNPRYLEVMRFLMEHKHNCGCINFEVLSEHELPDEDLMRRHKNIPPYEAPKDKPLAHVIEVREILKEIQYE